MSKIKSEKNRLDRMLLACMQTIYVDTIVRNL